LIVSSCQRPVVDDAASSGAEFKGAANISEDEELFSTRLQVYEEGFDGSTKTSETRGFVEHRRRLHDDEGIFYVYAVREPMMPIGFYMPSGQTFRYKMKRGGAVDTIDLGRLEPASSVRVLLDIQGNMRLDSTLKPWRRGGSK
jgi:hypothetical protein